MQTFFLNPISGVKLHCCAWEPLNSPRAIVQIIHGVAEHISRYREFAEYLTQQGILVVGEDHPGHGYTETTDDVTGYLTGGWNGTIDCVHALCEHTREQHPGIPYFMLGHSMGSFLLRSYLFDSRCSIDGAILSGTGWLPRMLLRTGCAVCHMEKTRIGDKCVSNLLNTMMFGGYNNGIKQRRTTHDWLTTDETVVDNYIADPLCGFPVTVQLCREMFTGMVQNQNTANLRQMDKSIPVLFAAGTDDPVGNMGKGVLRTVRAFQSCSVQDVTVNLYPGMRHEILNEKSKITVFSDILNWIFCRI